MSTTYTDPAGRYGDYSTAFIQAYIDAKIAGVLDSAPETLNTLNELAAALNDDPAFFSAMASANTTLQTNIDNLTTAAATARTAVQTALQTAIDAVQADVDQNKTDGDAALSTESAARVAAVAAEVARVNALVATDMWLFADQAAFPAAADNHGRVVHSHADGAMFYAHSGAWVQLANDSQITALQADVNQNETDCDSADAALSGRLDTLEADPTTAAAVAAVQADVDANETASDAAEAALSGRLDTLEADPTTKTYVDTQVAGLVDSAPGVLNTLDELAAALGDDANFATTITNSIAAVQADVNQNETDADAAIAAVQADVNQNESDADAAIAAVQADVDQNEADADAAVAAQNTAMLAAVAAVQADVDQNESDADTAIALKAALTGANFTGDLLLKKSDGSAVDLEFSRTDHSDMNTVFKIGASYVDINKECLVISGGGQPIAYFDERKRVSINKSNPNYTLDVDGDAKFSTGLTVGGLTDAANDTAAAAAGVAVNQLYRNGSVVMIRVS